VARGERCRRQAAALRRSSVLAKYEAEARRLAERDLRQGIELPKIFAWARSQREPPTLGALAGKLHIAELQRTAERAILWNQPARGDCSRECS